MDRIVYMPIEEFTDLGFLQEANRQFFHPLGLALEVETLEDSTQRLSGIWDSRSDPEGVTYSSVLLDAAAQLRAEHVMAERYRHEQARTELFGTYIQPIG